MVITFANQKGGCGKTTTCINFANYLASKGNEVLVLDVDFQRSIVDRRKNDLKLYDNEPEYEVLEIEIKTLKNKIEELKELDAFILIDLPGKIDDDNLSYILLSSDAIICPIRYDKLTMDSTALFIKITEYLEVSCPIFFVPNNLKQGVKYNDKDMVDEILKKHGFVTPVIYNKVALERLNTLVLTDDIKYSVKSSFDFIIKNLP